MDLPRFYGIDIGKSTVKVAVVQWRGSKPVIDRLLNFDTGEGSLTAEDINQRSSLSVSIKEAMAQAKLGTNKAVVALPEPVVFNRLLTFPEMDEKKLNEAIHWNAKQFIPVPVDEVQMDWIKTADMEINNKKMIQLLLVAAPKKIINQTTAVFADAEQELIAVETESIATSRAIAQNYQMDKPVMVMDLGSSGTDISVMVKGNLIFSQSLGTGSESMTNAIVSAYSIDKIQAEQYKIRFGLDQSQGDGKIYQTLMPIANIISNEVSKTLNFFKSKYQQNIPQQILIVGEGGRIPGLSSFMQQKLGIQTSMADLTQGIELPKKFEQEYAAYDLLGYAVAIGLALKTK